MQVLSTDLSRPDAASVPYNKYSACRECTMPDYTEIREALDHLDRVWTKLKKAGISQAMVEVRVQELLSKFVDDPATIESRKEALARARKLLSRFETLLVDATEAAADFAPAQALGLIQTGFTFLLRLDALKDPIRDAIRLEALQYMRSPEEVLSKIEISEWLRDTGKLSATEAAVVLAVPWRIRDGERWSILTLNDFTKKQDEELRKPLDGLTENGVSLPSVVDRKKTRYRRTLKRKDKLTEEKVSELFNEMIRRWKQQLDKERSTAERDRRANKQAKLLAALEAGTGKEAVAYAALLSTLAPEED